jgi:hypothetical protein
MQKRSRASFAFTKGARETWRSILLLNLVEDEHVLIRWYS